MVTSKGEAGVPLLIKPRLKRQWNWMKWAILSRKLSLNRNAPKRYPKRRSQN
jgi:hypothetical protein